VVAALGSFLQARTRGGEWLLRIENIDPPREVSGAADAILRELERLGLFWDGPVYYQHARREAHLAARDELIARNLAYHCRCSRRQIGPGAYPGTCRELQLGHSTTATLRLRVANTPISIVDALHGEVEETLAATCGDFVVWRVEDWPAYHLAVVVDDAWQGITEVVRGADLLDSSPRQRHLQRCLRLHEPRYCHLPLALDVDGAKLSKQTLACPVSGRSASEVLTAALGFLGHRPPRAVVGAAPAELLTWARSEWSLARVPLNARQPEPLSP
jgi:glutamyl-Q tRNA(Asp) synthetase